MLKFRVFGEGGKDIVLLHGMFASKENFFTLARGLSEKFRVFALDLRNHGESFHSEIMDYPSMASDVAEFIQQEHLQNPWLFGHSMGGKVAMHLALTVPDSAAGLIIEDIAPKNYAQGLDSEIDAMLDLPLEEVDKRSTAENWMFSRLDNRMVASFLLKNLVRNGSGGFAWRLNLKALKVNLSLLRDFPHFSSSFSGPVLFLKGGESSYIKPSDMDVIRGLFPSAGIETIDGVSHWVHAEKPAEVLEAVNRFIR